MTPRCVCGHSSAYHGRWGADPCNDAYCSCLSFRTEPDTATASSPSAARAAVDAAEVNYAGMQAVRDMPFDWYCPRSEAGRRRRDCPECVAEVALGAALPHLLAAIKAVDELADRFEDEGEQADASGSNFVTVGNWKAADRYAAKADAAHAHAAALRAALALAAVDVTETADGAS